MQNVLKIALIASVLLPLTLPAYAEEGTSQPQDKVIQPQTEIATRATIDHAGTSTGGYGLGFRGIGNPFGRVNAQVAKDRVSAPNVAGKFDKTEKEYEVMADSRQKQREREREEKEKGQERNEQTERPFEREWGRDRGNR